jgi:hypothetical protein
MPGSRGGCRRRSSPTPVEACAYAECAEPATVALRFGDGTMSVGAATRQTAVGYCDTHAALVKRLFVTCDERPAQATSSQ